MIKKDWYKNKTFYGWFIIIVMIASTIGFALFQGQTEQSGKKEYNGFKFYQTQDGWRTTVNSQQFSFRYLPDELENVSSGIINTANKKIYIVYNPEDEELNKDYFFRRVGGTLIVTNVGNAPYKGPI